MPCNVTVTLLRGNLCSDFGGHLLTRNPGAARESSPVSVTTERTTLERDPNSGLCIPQHLCSLLWDLPTGLSWAAVCPLRRAGKSGKENSQSVEGMERLSVLGKRVRLAEFRKHSKTNKWTHMWQGENKTTWASSTETQIWDGQNRLLSCLKHLISYY